MLTIPPLTVTSPGEYLLTIPSGQTARYLEFSNTTGGIVTITLPHYGPLQIPSNSIRIFSGNTYDNQLEVTVAASPGNFVAGQVGGIVYGPSDPPPPPIIGTSPSNIFVGNTIDANIQNAQLSVTGSVDANITNASIDVEANITNASIPVSGSVDATIQNATIDVANNDPINLQVGTNQLVVFQETIDNTTTLPIALTNIPIWTKALIAVFSGPLSDPTSPANVDQIVITVQPTLNGTAFCSLPNTFAGSNRPITTLPWVSVAAGSASQGALINAGPVVAPTSYSFSLTLIAVDYIPNIPEITQTYSGETAPGDTVDINLDTTVAELLGVTLGGSNKSGNLEENITLTYPSLAPGGGSQTATITLAVPPWDGSTDANVANIDINLESAGRGVLMIPLSSVNFVFTGTSSGYSYFTIRYRPLG